MNPEKLFFATTHEWVDLATDSSGTKIATVGVSAFALEALTDLVYVELPKVGRQLKAGETLGEIESVKAVSDLYSPVTGEVVAVHSEITERLETLNADPYGEGWLVKIKLAGDVDRSQLLDYKSYQKQCAEEGK